VTCLYLPTSLKHTLSTRASCYATFSFIFSHFLLRNSTLPFVFSGYHNNIWCPLYLKVAGINDEHHTSHSSQLWHSNWQPCNPTPFLPNTKFYIWFLTQTKIRVSIVNQLHAPVSQIYLFWINTLHVSDGPSVHHQEWKTVHTATGICQTDTCCCMYSLQLLMMDGKTIQNM
jgi:hypothetical protein